jgi:c-di-GMP-binding flagellar brake protein YcgR
MMGHINQRKFPRTTYPCYLTLWLDNKFDTILTQTVNISAAGVLVHVDHSLRLGSKSDVRIEFNNNIFFDCCGTIVRCQKDEKSEVKIYSSYFI